MSEKNNKPVIFLAFANEQGGEGHQGYLRKLPEEVRHLEKILERAEDRGLCELVIKTNATLEQILGIIEGEIDVLHIEKRIRGRVKQQMEKSQREYYLNEQMKAIQKELGDMEDAPGELDELQQKIDKAGMSKEANEKATSELNKLKMMSPMSAEATVVRNYIDWLVSVPWKKRSKIRLDLAAAEERFRHLRAAFGDAVIDHYYRAAMWEQARAEIEAKVDQALGERAEQEPYTIDVWVADGEFARIAMEDATLDFDPNPELSAPDVAVSMDQDLLALLPLLDEDYRRLRLRLSAVVIACLLVAAIVHTGITA